MTQSKVHRKIVDSHELSSCIWRMDCPIPSRQSHHVTSFPPIKMRLEAEVHVNYSVPKCTWCMCSFRIGTLLMSPLSSKLLLYCVSEIEVSE